MSVAVFNGVDVLLFTVVVLCAVTGRWCLRRHEKTQRRKNDEAIAQERRERVACVQTWADWDAVWPQLDRDEREAA